ncbi:MAG: type II toxin-antitoxin system VapB family antitoxin, partial [Coriobacteriia bacterium]|nr:type II toxin-antitoxin system VapB family antitoxin [Coriobacteriia bacterium]
MRTNIVIDETLMLEAKELTGLSTMREVVNEALTELVQRKKVGQLSDLEGKIRFYDGYDYKALRG